MRFPSATRLPTASSGPAFEVQVAAAKAVCAACPVRSECLADALERVPFGIAGGLTDVERRRLRHDSVRTDEDRRLREGQRLLAAGRSPQEVSRCCEVTERTAQRWAARLALTTMPETTPETLVETLSVVES